ncbi:glycosyltransferase [Mesonia sp. K7]|uniref:glycosyltransferase n=1 Tax=Mesonia sp. K7 TaxID=2218606 RepID=UPI000DA81328|nr:glycosyltransferase [Mesonia sp. K7]PZD79109.1 glycosyl transferase family 1 [Mesonia sp. K7]
MKVLHVGKYYPPFYGGIEKVNYDLVETLNEKGIQTDVFCFNHKKGSQTTQRKYKIQRTGVWITKFSTPISFSIFKDLHEIYQHYDIIHLHMPNPTAAIALQFLPFKGKIILHWHLDIVKQKLIKTAYKPFQTHLLKKADAVIVTSPDYLESSKDLQSYKDKCHVIPLGIDETYLKENIDFRSKLAEKYKSKKVVFSLGRLIYYKGFEYLIEAAKHLDENTIVLIGGIGALKDKLQKQIIDNHLQKKVKLIGKIPSSELAEYYKRADVFCLPSIERSEAFGIVLLEAMALGCPLITTSIGSGTSWVNQHQETGLVVTPKNSIVIADAIKIILSDKKSKVRYSENAQRRFNNHFKLEQMTDKTLHLYRNLLKEK